MAEKQPGNMPRGGIRALYEWLTGPTVPLASGNSSTARPDELLPARIGRYAIERKLGEGGMGVVYAARDDRLERTIALKTLTARTGDDPSGRRLLREARAAASVNHPNVCQIYEIGEDEGRMFIAMELLEGEALGEQLQRGPLSVSEAVRPAFGGRTVLEVLHATQYEQPPEHESGMRLIRRAVSKGYFVASTLTGRQQFDPLRRNPEFLAVVEEAESGRQRALAAFRQAGGERLIDA